jgi:hypothetical protein
MYLILGNDLDPCGLSISAALQARGLLARSVDSLFAGQTRLSWSLSDYSQSRLILDDGEQVTSDQLDGVVVRGRCWIQGNDWLFEDHEYMQAETQAAVLGWLWSLSCPVLGRVPASLWYRPLTPIAFWQPLLDRCGLDSPETLVTNLALESRAFRARLGGVAVYGPFSTTSRYPLTTDDDWKGIEAIEQRVPVCLASSNELGQSCCLVGQRVIWNGEPPVGAAELETGLARFAAAAELNFVQFTVARSAGNPRVIDVDPQPRLDQFGDTARRDIVLAALELLTGLHAKKSNTRQP